MLVTGVDIIEIRRIERAVSRWGTRFLNRIYTKKEQAYCRGRVPSLAARFAAKEATMKALGTGIRGIGWREIEVVREHGRPPTLCLHGKAARKSHALGIKGLALSLSHSKDYAVASVVGWCEAPP
jgi:holo-[acyl-carrier protein] synthase